MTRTTLFTERLIDAWPRGPALQAEPVRGSLAAPSSRTELHFFGTYERTREHSFFTVNATGAVLARRVPLVRGRLVHEHLLRPRRLPDQHACRNLFYRYVNQHTEFFCSGCGGVNASFSSLDNLIPRDMHALGHTWVLSNRC
jgi:hypothetical protein